MIRSLRFRGARGPDEVGSEVDLRSASILAWPNGEPIRIPAPDSTEPHFILFTSRALLLSFAWNFGVTYFGEILDVVPVLERAVAENVGVLVDPRIEDGNWRLYVLLRADLVHLTRGGTA